MKRILVAAVMLLAVLCSQAQSYRYFKVETLQSDNFKWQELEWIEGETAHPQVKMTSANSNGMLASGSSGAGEVYKPYDGDIDSHAWVGAREPGDPHWITLDVGAGNEIDPDSLRITKPTYSLVFWFRVWASNDNMSWELMLDSADIQSSGFRYMTFYLTEIADTEAPTIPEQLEIAIRTTNQLSIYWEASQDDRRIAGYEIYVDNALHGTSTFPSYTIDELASGTSYEIFVRAFDEAGNFSANSDTITVVTKVPDTEPPGDPANLVLTESTWDKLTFSWDPATDNDELAGYLVYLNDVIAGVSVVNTFAFPGLEPDSLYTIKVISKDAAGLLSEGYAEAQFRTNSELPDRMPIGTNFWNLGWGGPANDPFTDGYRSVGSDGNPWKQAFLDETSFYSHYRFMDWVETNHSEFEHWNERTPRSAAKQNPVSFELMIDLCNRQGVDLWITVPHKIVNRDGMQGADNHFAKKLSVLVKTGIDLLDLDLDDEAFDNISELTPKELIARGGVQTCEPLDPGLKFYIEYSNETWNYSFSQADYCRIEGMALDLPGDQYAQGRGFHAWAALRLFEAVEDVFGAGNPRIMRMDAYQAVVPSQINDHYAIYQTAQYNPQGIYPDAFCPAPYVGNGLNGADQDIYIDLIHGSSGIMARKAALRTARIYIDREIKKGYPVNKLIAYEAGQHMVNNAHTANRKEFMYDLYVRYLDSMNTYLDEMSHYLHTSTFGPGGCWGAKEGIGQAMEDAHKYRALFEWSMGTAIRPDTEAPTAPGNLSYTDLSETSYVLHWTEGTDNQAVTSYLVVVNSQNYGSSTDTSLLVTGLNPGTTNSNVVYSMDEMGNISEASEKLMVEMPTSNEAMNSETTMATVYPNPTDGIIRIKSPEQVFACKVMSVNGKVMINQKAGQFDHINISALSSGIYILELEWRSKDSEQYMILKQ